MYFIYAKGNFDPISAIHAEAGYVIDIKPSRFHVGEKFYCKDFCFLIYRLVRHINLVLFVVGEQIKLGICFLGCLCICYLIRCVFRKGKTLLAYTNAFRMLLYGTYRAFKPFCATKQASILHRLLSSATLRLNIKIF